MVVYRIVKELPRTKDLSGIGAFRFGGRWNSPGTYMLYASENRSLAYLESLVNFDADNLPPDLYIMSIEIAATGTAIYTLPSRLYPKEWKMIDNLQNKAVGDKLMAEQKYLAIKVASAVNPYEFNYLINPLYAGYGDMVKVGGVEELKIDGRLFG